LIVDALLTAKLISRADFEHAVAITREEIAARIAVGDCLPTQAELLRDRPTA
jgi:hypothetical protein